MFDFDWTLVKPKNDKTSPVDVDDWEWFRPCVKAVVQKCYKRGFGIVIVSNQSKKWKQEQICRVVKELSVPVHVCVATSKENYKPNTLLFKELLGERKLNLDQSFFVGDALGRPNDYSDVDIQFARNLGISKIYPPEDFFTMSNANVKTDTKKATGVEQSRQEIVVMVGYPGSGKSTYCLRNFPSYFICSGDEYKTSKKMTAAAKPYLDRGTSVVFDATNPSKEKRAEYITFARSYKLPIRCVHINTSLSESLISNNKREKPVPKIVYNIYKSKFETPDISEGFEEVLTIDNL